jgi:Predicted membrane protein
MKKTKFYTEFSYLLGIAALALGTAFMEKANMGISMVVAPAYLIYVKLSKSWAWITFGMAEYTLQLCLLVIMALFLRKFKAAYFFSFFTAIIYGFTLDGCMRLIANIDTSSFTGQIAFYTIGLILCAIGVAFIFHTYIAPEVYELFVKEVSAKTHSNINHFKIGYDCVSCLIGIILSFLFFGVFHFEGVRFGTIICALLNGKIIGIIGNLMERHLDFMDGLPLRKYF